MPTTLHDIAVANAADHLVPMIDESIKAIPELEKGEARTIKGLNYNTWVRTALPSVAFRAANEGSAAVKGTYENRLVGTYLLNPRWECDRAIADGYEDGAEAYIAVEADALMKASMQQLAKVFYYGQDATFGDTKGFPGLLASVDSGLVVDAGGTTDNTATSVWGVKFGPGDIQWVWGQNGQMQLTDPSLQRVLDGNSNPYTAWVQELLARPGLQVGNKFSLGRIKKITDDANCGLTDKLFGKLFAKFKVGYKPDAWFVTRRALEQLRASRTATNPTGQEAPTPTSWEGIPIYATDAISDIETLAL